MIATLKYLRSKYLYIFLAIGLSVLAVYLIKRSEISFDFIGNISWYLMLLVFLCLILVIVYLYKKNSGDKKTSEKEIVSSLIEPYEKFYSLLASTLNKVGINSDRYIYAKPWYLFIGNNGAGKSSIINNSELTFERSEEVDLINRKIQASNGPVQFYLSSEAVIVERVEEENSDGNWPEFLKWLNNKKKGRPLNGLVVSIDIESLVNSSVNERKVLAKKVTDEVRSLNDLLGIRLPVYLVVTKVDLLEGFTEFYAEDSTEDFEDSLFCFTFPLAIDSKQGSDMDWAGTFSEQYGVLIDYLNESLQERIINEDISVEVYAFVRQMIGFKTILYSFLSEVFKESAHSTYPLLRCIFFTSSEQQSLPFNAVAESVSNLFGAPELVYLQRRGYSKNIFIKNIFLKKILPESGLVGDSFYVQKKQLRSHIVQYVICGLLVVLASSAWSYYYQSNKLSANNVLSGLESYSAIDKNRKITSPEDHLQGLNILREALDEYAIGGKKTGIFSDLGLYKGGLINPSVEKTYRKLISDGFFNSLITDMLSSKIQIGEKDSLEGFKTLRIVRLISESANQINLSANEIKLLKQYKQSIVIPRMEQRWQQRFSGDAKKQNELMKHLSYGLEHVGVELNLSQQVKLKKLQTTLANVSLPRRLYNQLRIESEYELGQGLSLRHEIGGSFDEIFSQNSRGNIKELDGATIPAFLTFNGFHEFYVPRYKALMSMVALDTWAMGRIENPKYFSDADIKRFQSLINDMYLDDYKKAWVNAASSINLIEFENDLGIAVKRLNSLAVSDSPYRSLLRTIKRNTILLTEKQPLVIKNTDDKDIDDPNIVSLKSALVTPQLKLDIVTPLKKYFHIYNDFLDSPEDRDSAYIDDIEAALTKLYDYMSDIQQNQVLGDNKGYALKKVMQRLELKSDDDPFYLVYRLASGLAQPMQGHLNYGNLMFMTSIARRYMVGIHLVGIASTKSHRMILRVSFLQGALQPFFMRSILHQL